MTRAPVRCPTAPGRIYERLGLWPVLSARAEPIRQIHVSDRGRFGATRLSAESEGVPALGYVVENAWLGQCLWQALDAEVVEWRLPGGSHGPAGTRRRLSPDPE